MLRFLEMRFLTLTVDCFLGVFIATTMTRYCPTRCPMWLAKKMANNRQDNNQHSIQGKVTYIIILLSLVACGAKKYDYCCHLGIKNSELLLEMLKYKEKTCCSKHN